MRFTALSIAGAVFLLAPAAPAAPWDKPGWTLTFHDEFDTGQLDPARWMKRYKWGEAVINQELQAYVDDAFVLDGDVLRIVGSHEAGDYAGQTMQYRSGVISSVHEQRYGYFEIRCRMPAGRGLWPAFWLLGAVGTQGVNEIDIHEFLGHELDTMYMTIHWGPSYDQGHESSGEAYQGPDFSQDFHTFGVDWDAQRVIWYVDGIERFNYAGPGVPQVDMYVITNLAIGGSWPGAPDGTTTFPAYYDVDYIRVYERAAEVDAGPDGAGTDGGGPSGDAAVQDAAAPPGDAGVEEAGGEGEAGAAGSGGAGPEAGAASRASEEADGCACRASRPRGSASAGFALLCAGAAHWLGRRRRGRARATRRRGTHSLL